MTTTYRVTLYEYEGDYLKEITDNLVFHSKEAMISRCRFAASRNQVFSVTRVDTEDITADIFASLPCSDSVMKAMNSYFKHFGG